MVRTIFWVSGAGIEAKSEDSTIMLTGLGIRVEDCSVDETLVITSSCFK